MVRGDDESLIDFRPGTYGHPRTVFLRIPDEEVAGCHDEKRDMGAILAKVGMLALAGLLRYQLEDGVDGLLRALTKYAGIDMDALRAAAEQETGHGKDEAGDGSGVGGSGAGTAEVPAV